jgi:hypothetical protein
MFGFPVPQEIVEKRGQPARYWGARAIFHPGMKYPIDLLPDRQSCECGSLDPTPLINWVNKVGLKALQKLPAFRNLSADSRETVEFKDRQFTIQCCPNGSYGYLYIGAWQYWPENCQYEQKCPTADVKWSGKMEIPPIGAKVKCNINGRWEGVVTGYFVEHGYQGIECSCSVVPEFFTRQGSDKKRVLFFGVDLTDVLIPEGV